MGQPRNPTHPGATAGEVQAVTRATVAMVTLPGKVRFEARLQDVDAEDLAFGQGGAINPAEVVQLSLPLTRETADLRPADTIEVPALAYFPARKLTIATTRLERGRVIVVASRRTA